MSARVPDAAPCTGASLASLELLVGTVAEHATGGSSRAGLASDANNEFPLGLIPPGRQSLHEQLEPEQLVVRGAPIAAAEAGASARDAAGAERSQARAAAANDDADADAAAAKEEGVSEDSDGYGGFGRNVQTLRRDIVHLRRLFPRESSKSLTAMLKEAIPAERCARTHSARAARRIALMQHSTAPPLPPSLFLPAIRAPAASVSARLAAAGFRRTRT